MPTALQEALAEGRALAASGRFAEALASFQTATGLATAAGLLPAVRDQLAAGLRSLFAAMDRSEGAPLRPPVELMATRLAALGTQLAAVPDPQLRAQGVEALCRRAVLLGRTGPAAESLAACQEALAALAPGEPHASPGLRLWAVQMHVEAAEALLALGRPDEVPVHSDAVVEIDSAVHAVIALALRAEALVQSGCFQEAVDAAAEALRRNAGHQYPAHWVARARVVLGDALSVFGLHAEALAAYTEAGVDPEAADIGRDVLARAEAGRSEVLADLERHPEALAVGRAVVDRYAAESAGVMQAAVTRACVAVGRALHGLRRDGEAAAVLAEAVSAAALAADARVQQQVARALLIRANLLWNYAEPHRYDPLSAHLAHDFFPHPTTR